MYQKLKSWYYRTKARLTLIQRYEYLHEVDTLLEEYTTKKILEGGSQEFLTKGRQDLINKQAEIREHERFVEFLKNTK